MATLLLSLCDVLFNVLTVLDIYNAHGISCEDNASLSLMCLPPIEVYHPQQIFDIRYTEQDVLYILQLITKELRSLIASSYG